MSTVLNEIVSNYSYELLQTTLSSLQVTKNNIINEYLTRIMNHKDDSAYCDHELANFQVEVQKILAKYRMLIKFTYAWEPWVRLFL